MLRIRLTRIGKKRQPYYRVVVADRDAPRDGAIVERIGHYNPLADPAEFQINEDRALYWLSVGASPTDAVRRLLEKQGTYQRLERLRAGEPLETLVAETRTEEPVAVRQAPVAEAATVAESAAVVAEATGEAGEPVAAIIDEVDAATSEEEE